MGKFIKDDVKKRILELMFANAGDTPLERRFIETEMGRYAQQFTGADDAVITQFGNYQLATWIQGQTPQIGRPIASLNPTFIGSLDEIIVRPYGKNAHLDIYTRAAKKENGYRVQLHVGPQESHVPNASAFTRQFTPYDLRMFPELHETFAQLPVMIGDAELISRDHEHMAGFNRVQVRIPGTRFWPRRELGKLDDELLAEYLASEIFKDGMPLDDLTMTLSFHGLFAIADPDTWNEPHEVQAENIISLANFPVDYRAVDGYLDQLETFIAQHDLNARVAERRVIPSKQALSKYVKANEKAKLEGTIVVQSARDEDGSPNLGFAKSIKIKTYETVDTVLLGLYLHQKADGLAPENLKGALLGLFDDEHGVYLPVCKVNLDPNGVQIKNDDQRARLNALNRDLVSVVKEADGSEPIITLQDLYFFELAKKMQLYLGNIDEDRVTEMFSEIPKGQNVISLMERYQTHKDDFVSGKLGQNKTSSMRDKWIAKYHGVIEAIEELKEDNMPRYRDLTKYLAQAKNIRVASRKLVKPQFVVATDTPVIVEAQVFGIKYDLNPFAAGFHSWAVNSFHFNNCYAERLRPDKASTTDYETVRRIAKTNTVKPKRK